MKDRHDLSARLVIYRKLTDCLAPLEVPRLARSSRKLAYAPVFIVGAPRSGTTLLYQLITSCFDCAYLPNLADRLCTTPVLATRLATRNREPHASDFRSDYGMIRGWRAPSEGGNIWNRWFPTTEEHGYNYTPAGYLGERDRHLIYQTVAAVEALANAPFVSKNVKHSVRIRALAEIFPGALFIHVQRDPFDMAASILHVRKTAMGDVNAWFSVLPESIESLRRMPWPDQVAGQVCAIAGTIDRDTRAVAGDRLHGIPYDSMCEDPGGVLGGLVSFLSEHSCPLKQAREFPSPFKAAHAPGEDDPDMRALREAFDRRKHEQ